MNVFLAQQNYHIGDFDGNTRKIVEAIRTAKARGGDLIVFSELCVCGYPPRDFLEFDDFLQQSERALDRIRREASEIGVIVGAPTRNAVIEGKDLFNSAYLLEDQQVAAVVHKTLLPTYDVFDEYRYFEPSWHWEIVLFRGVRIALTICEDIWNLEDNPMYRFSPMDQLAGQQPELMINISASPFDYGHAAGRISTVKRNVLKYGLPMIYCNTTGAQTDLVFDGGSLVMNASGAVVKQLPFFKEAVEQVSWHREAGFDGPVEREAHAIADYQSLPERLAPESGVDMIYEALLAGIRDYFKKMGFKEAVVASSGGIDSALVQALACAALGPANVRAVMMPSHVSTAHSVSDAVKLSQNLGCRYDVIEIERLFEQYEQTLAPLFDGRAADVTEENLQSRIRGVLVMAVSNKFGCILLNTSNKSELATGYGTLYGDMAGGLGVLGDCYKLQVYALARYINRNGEVIPDHILTKAPSAELRAGQKDTDSLPDYSVLDPILYQYIERRQGPAQIISHGYDAALVRRVLKLVNQSEYKRNQFCPIIRVSPKAFGAGRRVPIVATYLA